MLLATTVVLCYRFKTELQNAIIGEGRFGFEALNTDSVRFVAKRLASLLKYQYTMG